MPGTARAENLEVLSDYFDWKKISTGKILRDHVAAKGPHADRISECFKNFQFGKYPPTYLFLVSALNIGCFL